MLNSTSLFHLVRVKTRDKIQHRIEAGSLSMLHSALAVRVCDLIESTKKAGLPH